MLKRVWAAENEKAVMATKIEECEAAVVTAEESERAELEDERQGFETSVKIAEADSAAAQARLNEGGNGDLIQQVLLQHGKDMQEIKQALVDVRQEMRVANVMLTSLAMDELDCPRLVFITPHTEREPSRLIQRLTRRLSAKVVPQAQAQKHRLIFLDPVTGSAVPCGIDERGYILSLPSDFLMKHGSRIQDGLKVVKFLLTLGKCTGLPGPWDLDELFLPPEVIAKEEARAVQAFEALLKSAIAPPAEKGTQKKKHAVSETTGVAYRALRQLVKNQCDDPDLLQCGLEKVTAQDGTIEWVAAESKERFIKAGAACLIWNARE